MGQFLGLITLVFISIPSLAGFSDIDLLVREALDREFYDDETCPNFYEDYYDFEILQVTHKGCEMSVQASVNLTPCGGESAEAPVVQALVCLSKTQEGHYQSTFLESWRQD